MARIFWMLGLKRRRERLWEWEMLFPNPGVLPHTSHTEAMTDAGYCIEGPSLRPLPGGKSENHRAWVGAGDPDGGARWGAEQVSLSWSWRSLRLSDRWLERTAESCRLL